MGQFYLGDFAQLSIGSDNREHLGLHVMVRNNTGGATNYCYLSAELAYRDGKLLAQSQE